MPDDHLCTVCHAWMCRADDAWCGYCGAGCAQLWIKLIPPVLEMKQVAPLVCIAVTNASCADLLLDSQTSTATWITLQSNPDLRAGAGETVRIWCEARTLDLQAPAAGEIVVATRAGEARGELLVVEATPRLTHSPEEIVFWSAKGESGRNGINFTSVAIAPDQGKLKILAVRSGLARQLAISEFAAGHLASRQEPLQITIGVEDERLLSQNWPPTLAVEYEGAHGVRSMLVQIPMVVKQAPQLTWQGADEEPATRFYSERQMVSIVLSNRDPTHRDGGGNNADLVIDAVTLSAPEDLAVTIRQTSRMPLRVAGGAVTEVRFELDLGTGGTRLGVRDQGERLAHFALEVRSNAGVMRRKMALRLEPLRVFDGIVAIDFGSSNTCCAVVLPGDRPSFLKIDEERTVAPTVVRYLDMTTRPAEVAVGLLVKALAARSEEVAASTVGRLKQRLGDVRESIDVRPRNSDEWVTRRASEAAADYLREIRRRAEAEENAIFWDFILTHPARCPLRQYRRMHEALQEAFGQEGKRIQYLQEPIAALLPFFAEKAERAIPLDYIAASFDLGGGTTDVAVVRVRQTCPDNGEVEIEPEVLFCQGARFGGEDLTDYLETALRKRCVERLKQEESGSELITKQSHAAAKADVLMNSAALRAAAEGLKASLSEEGDVQEPELVTLRIRHVDGKMDVYPFRFAALCTQDGLDLRVEFAKYIDERVSELTGLLQPAADKGITIGSIQLSGMTSFLPAVGKVLQRTFPNAVIQRAVRPKECVVLGACLVRTMRSGSVRLKMSHEHHRMTSSIGIWLSRTSPFIPILSVDAQLATNRIAFAWDGVEAISLWENTGADHEDPRSLYERALLTRLGSWRPRTGTALKGETRFLSLTLNEMQLTVVLVSEDGVETTCVPTQEDSR